MDVPTQIAALEAAVLALQTGTTSVDSRLSALEASSDTTLAGRVGALETDLLAAEGEISSLNSGLSLAFTDVSGLEDNLDDAN